MTNELKNINKKKEKRVQRTIFGVASFAFEMCMVGLLLSPYKLNISVIIFKLLLKSNIEKEVTLASSANMSTRSMIVSSTSTISSKCSATSYMGNKI